MWRALALGLLGRWLGLGQWLRLELKMNGLVLTRGQSTWGPCPRLYWRLLPRRRRRLLMFCMCLRLRPCRG